jgi:hypothetical protein
VLRFSSWTKDFNPNNQKLSHAQVLIMFLNLPQHYLRKKKKTLFEIACSIGTPLAIDENTKNKRFGHYARISMDIDLSQNIRELCETEEVDFVGSGDKSVFDKRHLFRVKFEYVIFVT